MKSDLQLRALKVQFAETYILRLVAKQLPKLNLKESGMNIANFTMIYTQTPIKKKKIQ